MLQTPFYLIDKPALQDNLRSAAMLRELSGVKILLALKCFSSWPVFELMRGYLDGSTSSSLYELKLGRSKFGGETHAYSVAWADHEIDEVITNADKVIFNSVAQLKRYESQTIGMPRGLRINPLVSAANFDLADPARPYSRLGEWNIERVEEVLDCIDGVMIHNNCENDSFERFDTLLTQIEGRFGALFSRLKWITLGGGIQFTAAGYPLFKLAKRLKEFAQRYEVQVYLEPGEALVSNSASLEVTVLDVFLNEKSIAVVDSSVEAHMLDLLIYRESARVEPNVGPNRYQICGKTCLAGDVFGEFDFPDELKPGSRISIRDAAAYTMVKKNWFNGLAMPSIAVKEQDGSIKVVREFGYEDYLSSLGA